MFLQNRSSRPLFTGRVAVGRPGGLPRIMGQTKVQHVREGSGSPSHRSDESGERQKTNEPTYG